MRVGARPVLLLLVLLMLGALGGCDGAGTVFGGSPTTAPGSSVAATTSAGSSTTSAEAGTTTVAATTTVPEPTTTVPEPTTSGATPTSGAAACSAYGMTLQPAAADLPQAVVAEREAIGQAAIACDYQALRDLASWEFFAYASEAQGDPAGYWQEQEAGGGTPLGMLVATLNLPPARVEAEGDVSWIWPSAAAATAWNQVPAAEQQALVALYGEGVSQDWATGGEFTRYRTAIGSEGLWSLFLTEG